MSCSICPLICKIQMTSRYQLSRYILVAEVVYIVEDYTSQHRTLHAQLRYGQVLHELLCLRSFIWTMERKNISPTRLKVENIIFHDFIFTYIIPNSNNKSTWCSKTQKGVDVDPICYYTSWNYFSNSLADTRTSGHNLRVDVR